MGLGAGVRPFHSANLVCVAIPGASLGHVLPGKTQCLPQDLGKGQRLLECDSGTPDRDVVVGGARTRVTFFPFIFM